jgi:hypothetical protein
MRRLLPLFFAALLLLGFGERVQAGFIYHFATTTPAGPGGSLDVTITASDAAVATGMLTANNIDSLVLILSGTTAPFMNFTSTDKSDLTSPVLVDPTTGAFQAFTPVIHHLTEFAETVDVTASTSTTHVPWHDFAPGSTPQNGEGSWSVTPTGPAVPEPSSLVLAGVGGVIALAGAFRRCRRQEGPAPTR